MYYEIEFVVIVTSEHGGCGMGEAGREVQSEGCKRRLRKKGRGFSVGCVDCEVTPT